MGRGRGREPPRRDEGFDSELEHQEIERQAWEEQGAKTPLQTSDLGAKVLLQTAVLASLNLIDEKMKLEAEYEAAESQIEQRTSRLINRVFETIETVDPKGG